MNQRELRAMGRADLQSLFEERRAELVQIRDEIDRRDKAEIKKGVPVEFTQYVED